MVRVAGTSAPCCLNRGGLSWQRLIRPSGVAGSPLQRILRGAGCQQRRRQYLRRLIITKKIVHDLISSLPEIEQQQRPATDSNTLARSLADYLQRSDIPALISPSRLVPTRTAGAGRNQPLQSTHKSQSPAWKSSRLRKRSQNMATRERLLGVYCPD